MARDYSKFIRIGILPLPSNLFKKVNASIAMQEYIEDFYEHLWHNYLMEKEVSLAEYIIPLNDDERNVFNACILLLSMSGWIVTSNANNYTSAMINDAKIKSFVDEKTIHSLRIHHKMDKYILRAEFKPSEDKVKLSKKVQKSGIIRKGLAKASCNIFRYAIKYILKYKPYIAHNIYKNMSSSIHDVTYQDITHSVLNHYINYNNIYTLNENISDSRGRATFQCVKKLFNPISSKDARACVIIPYTRNVTAYKHYVYAFITELLGYKASTFNEKVEYGFNAFKNNIKPSIQDIIKENNFDDLHVLIWLERIYSHIHKYGFKNWNIPIEIDATASVLQWIGVLTNDHDLLKSTNVIANETGKLMDAWTLKPSEQGSIIPRTYSKKAFTPTFYGSSASVKDLWIKHKFSFTQDMVNYAEEQKKTGIFAGAAKFKDFIIGHVQTKPNMKVTIGDEVFWIACNKFIPEYDIRVNYSTYITGKGIQIVSKSIEAIPDLLQFKSYFVTLLIHNLDSQANDYICQYIDWVLPNHDAWCIMPDEVDNVTNMYIYKLFCTYTNRHSILKEYFRSIGITEEYKDRNTIELTINDFQPYCLK